MKILFMTVLLVSLFCVTSESRIDTLKLPLDKFMRVETDSPATISWGFSPYVKKYLLYCRYDHEDTSWFIVDSILRGDNPYIDSSYTIQREAVTERLLHSCKEDSLFFLTIQAINDNGTYSNSTLFFVDSVVSFGNWILWKSRIIPLRPFPMRVRYFE